ncbi:hypothetical protein [Manganibacter manganicus]|uniref:Uncharacterized protein n=1 Tax=Manganibacter manganicus TaxID=1873176 RepID=A0A1V8RTA0_9HYPH|nr:hypothetical protein [Pseudaminobacter manganicus]OQM76239.1 hypothetical protein BFN67_15200 [Pseudaminobacter manganicus]
MAITLKKKKAKPTTVSGQPKAGGGKPQKKLANNKKSVKEFEVRPGTAAVCAGCMESDMAAGRLFHGFLELWVDTKKKIIRVHEGEQKEFLFLSSDDLRKLTGLTKWQIDKAVKILKASPFFIVKTGRIAPNAPNRYQMHFDAKCFWDQVEYELQVTIGVTELIGGFKVPVKEIDRKALPYLFKRLWDDVFGDD